MDKKQKIKKDLLSELKSVWENGESPQKIFNEMLKDKDFIIIRVGGFTGHTGKYYKRNRNGDTEYIGEILDECLFDYLSSVNTKKDK